MAKALHACASSSSSRGQAPKGYFAANFVDLRSVTLRSTIKVRLCVPQSLPASLTIKNAGEVRDKIEDYCDEISDKTAAATDRAQDSYQETKRTVEPKLDAAKKTFQKE